MRYFNRVHVFSLVLVLAANPFVALANEVFPTSEYVVPVYQAENGNTHEGDMMQVNSSGYLERVTPDSVPTDASMRPITSDAVHDALEDKESIVNKLTGATNDTIANFSDSEVKYPSAAAVTGYAIQKPATASAGKVLMYGTGATADSRPEAKYVQVPMANGDPAVSGNTVSGTASIWLQ